MRINIQLFVLHHQTAQVARRGCSFSNIVFQCRWSAAARCCRCLLLLLLLLLFKILYFLVNWNHIWKPPKSFYFNCLSRKTTPQGLIAIDQNVKGLKLKQTASKFVWNRVFFFIILLIKIFLRTLLWCLLLLLTSFRQRFMSASILI